MSESFMVLTCRKQVIGVQSKNCERSKVPSFRSEIVHEFLPSNLLTYLALSEDWIQFNTWLLPPFSTSKELR